MTQFPFIHPLLKLEYILEVNRFLNILNFWDVHNRDNYKLEKNEINIKKKKIHPVRFLTILTSPR